MFRRILVPLDGSALSELALEPAFCLAREFGSEIILLRIVLPDEANALPARPPHFSILAERTQTYELQAAEAYLRQAIADWDGQAACIESQVALGPPAQMIVESAREVEANLIVMSTHGRSGISRLLYGSVAEAVLRGAQVPVLLIPNRLTDGPGLA